MSGDSGSAEEVVAPSGGSLTSQVQAKLRADIIAGALAPGRKLKIDELKRAYAIGASPIREALSLLTSDGLVERVEQRGFRVAHVSVEAFRDLLRTRCWIEERALREAVRAGDPAWEERLLTVTFRLSRLARSRHQDRFEENPAWEVMHKAFHMALIAGCGSPITMRICDQLYDQNVRYRRLAGPAAYPGRTVADEHGAIAEAALERDADLAAGRLIAHYQATADYVVDRLSG
jgi:DNA-binding GntR family transcriptional regulator